MDDDGRDDKEEEDDGVDDGVDDDDEVGPSMDDIPLDCMAFIVH